MSDLVITGVIDGPLSGGLPKAVELYVRADIADLSVYGLGSANNGGGTDGEEFTFPAISATAGTFLYLASESAGFTTFMGFAPDFTDGSALAINGDDAIELFLNGNVVDVFGDPDTDGTGQAWDHLDGWAYRNANAEPSSTFNAADWTFSGTNALDNETSNATAGTPFPTGSYSAAPQPTVINAVLGSTTGNDSEYVEIFGEPGTSLDGLSLIVVESDAGSSNGTIDSRIDLGAGDVIGTNGFFLLANGLAEGTYGVTADRTLNENFVENSSYTLALVETATLTGTTVSGSETVIDAVGVTDGGASDSFAFGAPVVGPDGSFLPAGVRRTTDGVDTDSAGDFGLLDFGNDPAINTPTAGGSDTPPPGPTLTAIYDIQGAGHVSSLTGQVVLTSGIVTAVDSNGYYLQDATGDGDIATSDAIFVFTGNTPLVSVGDALEVSGTVSEFTPGGASTGNLSSTQLINTTATLVSSGNALPAATIIGQSGRLVPTSNIDDDAFGSFDPMTDGIDFFESLEAMLVTAEDLLAVSGTNRFGEIFAVTNQGVDATGISSRGTLNIAPNDFNPEKIQINEDTGILPGFSIPMVDVGAQLGDVTGVIGYSFGNYEILPTQAFVASPSSLTAEVTTLAGDADTMTVASYNVLNLDPNDADGDTDVADGRFDAIAAQIVANLGAPDVIGLQEIQDNTGSTDDGTVSASQTLQLLVDAIVAAGGPAYSFIDNTFIADNASGGQPGANIRTAFLYNDARVDLVPGSVQTIDGQGSGQAFNGARLPLVADFEFNGETVTVVNNHFSSKGGSAPILGVEQPFDQRQEDVTVNGSLDERQAQSMAVQNFLAAKLAADPSAKLVALGDFNEFEFVSPVTGLENVLNADGTGVNNLTNTLPEDERYSFNFQGNSQSLDHILVSDSLADNADFDIVHVNSEFADGASKASDHDPLLATLGFEVMPQTWTLELLHITDQEASTGSIGDFARASGILNALEAQDLGNDGIADNTVRLSSGDAIIPGVFYDASEAVFGAGGIADIQLVNEMGFDAVAFGNHEFDKGTAELAELIAGFELARDGDNNLILDADGAATFTTTPIGDFSALTGTPTPYTGTAFPYLSTNLDFDTDPALKALAALGGQAPQPNTVTSSTILDVNGEMLGVVGAVTPNLAAISSTGGLGISPAWADGTPTPAELDALAAEIQAEVDALLAANPTLNKVVLLAHMQQITIEQGLATRLENVDIIVAGGSNTRLFDDNDYIRPGDSDQGQYPQFFTNAGGTTTALVNTDGSYKYVGRLVIDFDADGNIIANSYDETVSGAYATDATGLANVAGAEGLIDPEVQAITEAIQDQILATEGNVFGVSNVFLNGNRSGTAGDPDGVRTQETNLGNLTADANLAYAQSIDSTVMVSIKNGGGIRASIGETVVPAGGTGFERLPNGEILDDQGNVVKPAGGISQNDIQTTLAFNNDLSLLTVTRAELIEILEHGISGLPGVSGRFPQVSGIQFSFDESLPAGSRIVNAAITDMEGNDLDVLMRDGVLQGDAAAGVRIVTLGFLAGGGDGYPFPQGPEANRVDLENFDGDGINDGVATFAADGTEQDVLAEYLAANFGDAANAYDVADSGPAGDTRIQNLAFTADTVIDEPEFNLILGQGARDRLTGTDEADMIVSGAGSYETMEGGLGGDVFVFGLETMNGLRERDIISDYEVGVDVIGLTGGATVADIRETSSAVVVYFDDPTGAQDALFVRGDGVTAANLTFETIDTISFV
ncbi:5'-nucleotidase C-terminal domain-containing protein [Meridianimarinicoccus roseus]|nr:5'-nucleotidase C-terminal domain-containing protein [Meridianimarinicoccus roseus]